MEKKAETVYWVENQAEQYTGAMPDFAGFEIETVVDIIIIPMGNGESPTESGEVANPDTQG